MPNNHLDFQSIDKRTRLALAYSLFDIILISMRSLILIGYRGTGKTTIARKLADRLGLPSFDSDVEIERQSGRSITEIFAHDGESAFRGMEESVIAEILASASSLVLATGGGAVLRSITRERLRQSGQVIWLTASPETILRRITEDAASKTMRPNLTSLPMHEEIVAILEQRKPLYGEIAHETIDTDKQTVDEIVETILQRTANPKAYAVRLSH
jgi:shikimate kinase